MSVYPLSIFPLHSSPFTHTHATEYYKHPPVSPTCCISQSMPAALTAITGDLKSSGHKQAPCSPNPCCTSTTGHSFRATSCRISLITDLFIQSPCKLGPGRTFFKSHTGESSVPLKPTRVTHIFQLNYECTGSVVTDRPTGPYTPRLLYE